MSASMADLSIPLTAWAAGKAALFTLLHSSILGGYPSAPAMANVKTVTQSQSFMNSELTKQFRFCVVINCVAVWRLATRCAHMKNQKIVVKSGGRVKVN